MMQLVMAAALFVLAVARVPALRRNGRDTVFVAAVFEGLAMVLINADVYTALDPALGGFNLVKLVDSSLMVAGLWFLRKAVLTAISPAAGNRRGWLARLPLIVALGLQCVFFLLAGPLPSTWTWGAYHHAHPFAALLSLVVIVFVGWCCGEIAWVCARFIPRMRDSFRVGFSMVALGCAAGIVTTALMTAQVLRDISWLPASVPQATQALYSALELFSIVFVGVGLTIPAVTGRSARKRAERHVLQAIARVEPIRERVLAGAGAGRALEVDANATPPERLHRMIVEIWDADLAAGTGPSVLTSEERAYLLSVETDLNLEHSK